MKNQRLSYFYKVNNLSNSKDVIKEILKIEGVTFAKIIDGILNYEISEWANEYDILTASMEICERFGGELIVADQHDLSFNSKQTDNAINSETKLSEDINAVEIIDNRAINMENSEIQSILGSAEDKNAETAEERETITVASMNERLKSDILTRTCELGLSLILLIVGLVLTKGKLESFSFETVVLVLAFSISAYELFQFAFVAVYKKQFTDNSIAVSLATIAMAFFGCLIQGACIAFAFGVLKLVKSHSERLRHIKLAKIFLAEGVTDEDAIKRADDEIKTLTERKADKTDLVFDVLAYVALLGVLFCFVCLIPAIELDKYIPSVLAICVLLTVLFEDIFRFTFINATISLREYKVNFKNKKVFFDIAKCNSLEIDVSALIVDSSNLKSDAIGGMKEIKSLGMMSLKTNFNVEVSEEIKKQTDFLDKDFANKKVLTVGTANQNVTFGSGGEMVEISDDSVALLPLSYKTAKKAVKSKFLSTVLTRASGLLLLAVPVFIIIGMTSIPLWLSAIGTGLLATAALLSARLLKISSPAIKKE